MRLHARLRRLEMIAAPASSICTACGHDPRLPPRLRLAQDDEIDGPDSCIACGWPLVLRLTLDDRD